MNQPIEYIFHHNINVFVYKWNLILMLVMRGLFDFPVLVSFVHHVHWFVLVLLFKFLYTFPFVFLSNSLCQCFSKASSSLPYGRLI